MHPPHTLAVLGGLITVDDIGPVGVETLDEAEGQQGVVHRGLRVLVQRLDLLIKPTEHPSGDTSSDAPGW